MIDHISAMQKLEHILNEQCYIICQHSGVKILDLEDVSAMFIPVNKTDHLIITVHQNSAKDFLKIARGIYSKTKIALENEGSNQFL